MGASCGGRQSFGDQRPVVRVVDVTNELSLVVDLKGAGLVQLGGEGAAEADAGGVCVSHLFCFGVNDVSKVR